MPGSGNAPAICVKGRVLIAEDDPETNDCLVESLLENGFEVASARDGAEALRFLDQAGFDAVVLDLVMPIAGGVAVLEGIRERGLDIPVVVISGYLGALDGNRLRELGASRVVPKPLSFGELVETVRRTIGRSREE